MKKNRKWNRILKLADFMEKLPRKRFDFNRWVGDDWKGKPDLSCGTTACALGWATSMPLFRKLGLQLVSVYDSWTGRIPAPAIHGNEIDACNIGSMDHAGEEMFGISGRVFRDLFVPGEPDQYGRLVENATPKQWARHARKIVKQLENEELQ